MTASLHRRTHRYTARALAKILNQKYYGGMWPNTVTYTEVERWDHVLKPDVNIDHWGDCPTCTIRPDQQEAQ